MANYFDEINTLIKVIVHKLEVTNKKGLYFGKVFDRLSILDIIIIGNVQRSGAITAKALVMASGIDRSVVTTSINNLIKNNILKKNQDEGDKRKFNLSLTGKGEDLVGAMKKREDEFLKFVLDEITINEAKAVLKFLSKVNQTTVEKFDVNQIEE